GGRGRGVRRRRRQDAERPRHPPVTESLRRATRGVAHHCLKRDGAARPVALQTRSITVALAWPPPSHMVWKPTRPPVASRWRSNLVINATPDAPRGWPNAIAP